MSTSRLHPLTTCCPPYLIGCVTMLRIRKLTGYQRHAGTTEGDHSSGSLLLLNTISHEGDIDARRYPQAAASVLNYGLPPLAGSFMYEHKWDDISEAIRRAIIRFEPRLNAATLRVTPLLDKTRQGSYNTLQFEIRGQILTQPYPTEFLVRSALDMELSRITFF